MGVSLWLIIIYKSWQCLNLLKPLFSPKDTKDGLNILFYNKHTMFRPLSALLVIWTLSCWNGWDSRWWWWIYVKIIIMMLWWIYVKIIMMMMMNIYVKIIMMVLNTSKDNDDEEWGHAESICLNVFAFSVSFSHCIATNLRCYKFSVSCFQKCDLSWQFTHCCIFQCAHNETEREGDYLLDYFQR